MDLIDTEGRNSLIALFYKIIQEQLPAASLSWLEEKVKLVQQEEKTVQLNMSFSHLSRFAPKTLVRLGDGVEQTMDQLMPGLKINDWSLERLSRVWLLTQVPVTDKESYFRKINGLFTAAEMHEQVALYSALPFYAHPELWISRCEEGIRSNIGIVLEAIMYHNPYPAAYLSEAAWNQLVLKAFFTEKDVKHIVGLSDRLNKPLADTLEDYVQERLAAHRQILPEIYQLIEQTKEKI